MSSPSDPVSSVLIAGASESLSGLATADGIDLVRGSASQQADQTWTVVAYATQAAITSLQNSGIDVTVLADPATLQARWDTVQGQVE